MVSVLILIRMRNAKSRLSGLLGREAREKLTALMFRRVLFAVSGYGVYVLSPTRLGGDFVWIKDEWTDINTVTGKAFKIIEDDLLILPSDVPAITKEDITRIISQEEDIVLVPAPDGGTNAIFIRKGIAFKTHYGPKSFPLHVREAQERGLSCRILHIENLRDVDTEEDLAWYYQKAEGEMKRFISSLLAKGLSNEEVNHKIP